MRRIRIRRRSGLQNMRSFREVAPCDRQLAKYFRTWLSAFYPPLGGVLDPESPSAQIS